MAGELFMDAVARGGATLLPIDSEHNAVLPVPAAAYARRPKRPACDASC